MTRPLVSATALALGLALPAQALDLDAMTDAERAAFRDEVRAYLMENPEVIMEAVAVLEQREADAQAQSDKDLVAANADALFDDGHSWVGGNPDGDITLVEFLDYRCGYCKRAHPEVTNLLKEDGNIRFIVKEFPILGEQSVTASRFAIATQQVAGDDAYHAVSEALMAYSGDITEPALRRMAEPLDLPVDNIIAAMGSEEVTAVIEENHALGRALQISGTPSFVMENQMLRGYVPQAEMEMIADEIRNEG
ncbi:DsbA family protein [Roseovarius atlanticus]|uniref:DsbA family protein n=1 Tax=Roseovarius atlanticus TaxID=1641875 RepID=UPI001C978998|nr:DsbA family protein [Roseovarius atlanticus]MBY5988468.1 DsbA family protein [Roseovarius atlanticus]MBY6123859.1 DsbA family protein [Roseovarius atlanticus]MBY6148354.1 DsbA family protein [Roseovarius atlanticus]